MMIQTLGKSYTVIRYCFSDSKMERFICKEDTSGSYVTVVRVKDRAWITHVMEFFVAERENKRFTDFADCFVSEECLHIVLKYTEGVSLSDKLSREHCTLDERLAIGRHLLERMMLLGMPDFFQQDCLYPESVVVRADLETAFNYELSDVGQYESYTFLHVQKRLLDIFELLFAQELKKRTVEPLRQMRDVLRRGDYADIVTLYARYNEMCTQIAALTPEEMATPKTWAFRVWDRIKKRFGLIKRLLAFVLFMAAIFFLIHTLRQSMLPDGEKKVFQTIGTLEIRNESNTERHR